MNTYTCSPNIIENKLIEVKRFQLPNFQENTPLSGQKNTEKVREYLEREYLNSARLFEDGRLIPVLSIPPNKTNVGEVIVQTTCPDCPYERRDLWTNATKTDENPSDYYIQGLYYPNGDITFTGFTDHETLLRDGQYESFMALSGKAVDPTYRVPRGELRPINELVEALIYTLKHKQNSYV